MTIQLNFYISPSGRICRLITLNGRIIAEFLVHGYLLQAAENAVNNSKIERGRINIFRGELKQLAPYEYLDTKEEDICERLLTREEISTNNGE